MVHCEKGKQEILMLEMPCYALYLQMPCTHPQYPQMPCAYGSTRVWDGLGRSMLHPYLSTPYLHRVWLHTIPACKWFGKNPWVVKNTWCFHSKITRVLCLMHPVSLRIDSSKQILNPQHTLLTI